jgi:hypothetical protein
MPTNGYVSAIPYAQHTELEYDTDGTCVRTSLMWSRDHLSILIVGYASATRSWTVEEIDFQDCETIGVNDGPVFNCSRDIQSEGLCPF